MIPGMDPLSMMFMMAGQQGQGDPFANPQMQAPGIPGAMMGGQQMMAPPAPAAAQQPGSSLGDIFAGVKAPEAQAPKFSGGVSGSGLPYVSRIEDMVSPFLQATGGAKAGMMPTLGQLISQAPGGGR